MICCSTTKILICALAAGLAFGAAVGRPVAVFDFEKWNDSRDSPAGEDWRWGFSQQGTNGFTACELSQAEFHDGRASLHLKDANKGNINHTMWYQFTRDEAKSMEGKVVRASAWIKQVSASDPRSVGIALYANGSDGKPVYVRNGVGTRAASDWVCVHAAVKMPDETKSARLVFNCANGYGNTGEIYVDDVVVSTDLADHPKPTLLPPSASAGWSFSLPEPEDTPEESAYRRGWREQPPADEDGRARPKIENGTWYIGDHPEFYMGVWLYNSDRQWGPNANPLGIDHPAYTTPPGAELFGEMGFNSSQISAAHSQIGAVVRGFPLPRESKPSRKDWKSDDADIARFFKRFGDMPMVLDFAFGYDKRYPKEAQALLDQRKSGSAWHAFIPFCPHVPEGWRYYRDYFLGGACAAMRHGCNVFLYELFNESSWNDMCRSNVQEFARAMKARYGSIAAANEKWGTCFDAFDDVACQVDLKQFPGVWYDWCRFSSKSYCGLLQRGIETIRSVDRRGNVYFTEQESGTPSEHRGIDYRDVAGTLDALAIEGGWRYGFGTDYRAKSEMEAVVATKGSRHFFNCDFYQALAKGRKPVVNNEHYCTRFENGKRVPSRRTDYITSLWLEVMHGVSGSFFYVWDKRYWEANTPEKAYANVVNPSYKSSSLLNPCNVRPEDLCAFRMFMDELAPFKDKVLPFPRTKPATVAVFYSKATSIQRDSLPSLKGRPGVSDWYAALLHANFPCRVVFDEDVSSLGPEVQALVFPVAACCATNVIDAARKFQERGGLVLADEEAFRFDEYMKPLPEDPGFVRVNNAAAAVERLVAANVTRYCVLTPVDGRGPILAADVQIIDRGDFKLVCCAAMGETSARRARLGLYGLLPGIQGFILEDPVSKRVYQRDGRKVWTDADLEDGVEIELPPQERVLLVLRNP